MLREPETAVQAERDALRKAVRREARVFADRGGRQAAVFKSLDRQQCPGVTANAFARGPAMEPTEDVQHDRAPELLREPPVVAWLPHGTANASSVEADPDFPSYPFRVPEASSRPRPEPNTAHDLSLRRARNSPCRSPARCSCLTLFLRSVSDRRRYDAPERSKICA